MDPADVGDRLELEGERLVAGGVTLAREPAGRVVLVRGALPGERVVVELDRARPTVAEGAVVRVLDPSPDRRDPPCPELAAGCGGCDLQHAAADAQRRMKVGVVADALARIGRFREVEVLAGEVLDPWGYRTTLRCGVQGGRPALRRRGSHDLHALGGCLVAHPLLQDLLGGDAAGDGASLGAAEGVTLRVGARTGERCALVAPSARGVELPDDVVVVGVDELAAGGAVPDGGWIHEVVGRRRLRVSVSSFLQARPDGTEALARSVRRALGGWEPTEGHLVDLYGGIGVLGATLGARRVTVVERSAAAAADAVVNLAAADAEVVRAAVADWRPVPADAVVADPARAGLGRAGVEAVLGTGAARVALVGCDPAAFARDLRMLVDGGLHLHDVELVDMFPHTHHVEAVASLSRAASPS